MRAIVRRLGSSRTGRPSCVTPGGAIEHRQHGDRRRSRLGCGQCMSGHGCGQGIVAARLGFIQRVDAAPALMQLGMTLRHPAPCIPRCKPPCETPCRTAAARQWRAIDRPARSRPARSPIRILGILGADKEHACLEERESPPASACLRLQGPFRVHGSLLAFASLQRVSASLQLSGQVAGRWGSPKAANSSMSSLLGHARSSSESGEAVRQAGFRSSTRSMVDPDGGPTAARVQQRAKSKVSRSP